MSSVFDPKELRGAYDRGRLVPFLGSGMSIPTCTNWTEFVQRLEVRAGIRQHADQPGATRLMERAATAMHALRLRDCASLTQAIRDAVYARPDPQITESTRALSRIYWPLVCTTNYDELYVSGLQSALHERPPVPGDSMRLEVLGRSEVDCRTVLQQLAFPTRRVLWALQGFLPPSGAMPDLLEGEDRLPRLEHELVVGHAEYRRAAHRAPHFRRVFAEVFRSRSFLFVGAGLSEPYFRALFDEIIELTGAPARPHYAFVREGAVDPDFMKREYHIICYCYPPKEHWRITKWIDQFRSYLGSSRVRLAGWSYDVSAPYRADATPMQASFRVVRSALVHADRIKPGEAIAISCGRNRTGACGDEPGTPVPGSAGSKALGLGTDRAHDWRGPWVVQWKKVPDGFGIVARECDGDERTPRAIRNAFNAFLEQAHASGYNKVHVQLLGAGRHRQFAPWVSLAQMARAYGDWARTFHGGRPPVEATVYVVDPGVIALLQGGFLDVSEELDGGHLRISIECIDDDSSSRYYELVSADARLSTLAELRQSPAAALLSCTPKAKYQATAIAYAMVKDLTFRDFGLVSGSTLHIDCRRESLAAAGGRHLGFNVRRGAAPLSDLHPQQPGRSRASARLL